jgi:hypothetical protein
MKAANIAELEPLEPVGVGDEAKFVGLRLNLLPR